MLKPHLDGFRVKGENHSSNLSNPLSLKKKKFQTIQFHQEIKS